jgi:hypothetical protein
MRRLRLRGRGNANKRLLIHAAAANPGLVMRKTQGFVTPRGLAQAALEGANASDVGVLLAALYSPAITEGVRDSKDVVAALIAFGLLEHWKAPRGSL